MALKRIQKVSLQEERLDMHKAREKFSARVCCSAPCFGAQKF